MTQKPSVDTDQVQDQEWLRLVVIYSDHREDAILNWSDPKMGRKPAAKGWQLILQSSTRVSPADSCSATSVNVALQGSITRIYEMVQLSGTISFGIFLFFCTNGERSWNQISESVQGCVVPGKGQNSLLLLFQTPALLYKLTLKRNVFSSI